MLHGLEQQNYVTGIREMLTLTSMWAFGYGAREVTSDRRSGNFPFKSINGKSLYSTVSQVSLPNKSGEGTVSRRHTGHYAMVPAAVCCIPHY